MDSITFTKIEDLKEKYQIMSHDLRMANANVAEAHANAKRIIDTAEHDRDNVKSGIETFLKENFFGMAKDFLGGARAVLIVSSHNKKQDAFDDIKKNGFCVVPAKLSVTADNIYANGNYACIPFKHEKSYNAFHWQLPTLEDDARCIDSLFLAGNETLDNPPRDKYIPLKEFFELKKYFDVHYQLMKDYNRTNINRFFTEVHSNADTSKEYFINETSDISYIYYVVTRGIVDDWPVGISYSKETGMTQVINPHNAWWYSGCQSIAKDEARAKLDEFEKLIGKRYSEILSEAEKWFESLERN